MSGSAILDGLLANLKAASVFGENQVSTDYAVMESTAACCAVVSFTGFSASANTFGNEWAGAYSFAVDVKLKDTGDPTLLPRKILEVLDMVMASLQSDDTLQGTATGLDRVEVNRTPGDVEIAGGATWIPVDMQLHVQSWDG